MCIYMYVYYLYITVVCVCVCVCVFVFVSQFDKLSNDLSNLEITDGEELTGIVNIIFDKVC